MNAASPWMLAIFLLVGAAVWTASILGAWLPHRRTDPFNWRLIVNPGLYYEWLSRKRGSNDAA